MYIIFGTDRANDTDFYNVENRYNPDQIWSEVYLLKIAFFFCFNKLWVRYLLRIGEIESSIESLK